MVNDINIEESKAYIDNGASILDVRTKEEFDGGHIENSMNIDVHSPTFNEQVEALDKNKIYVVYCASGGRSASVVQTMMGLGFTNAYNMSGGIAGWKKEGVPVV